MIEELINKIIEEEERGKEKWGEVDQTPLDLMIAIVEELGEAAHAINHHEGTEAVKQEIAEAMGLLSRLYEMVEDYT